MKTTVNIIPSSTNTVSIQDATNKIVVTDNSESTTVEVTQPITSVVQVLTGAQGKKGDQGEVGPAGPTASFDSGSFVTTASFNSFTSSYTTDSSSFNSRIGSLIAATSSYVLNSQTSSMTVLSASFARTASFLPVGTYAITSSWAVSASRALTASYALRSDINTGSFAVTGSNIFKGNQTISGSVTIRIPGGSAVGQNENPTNSNVFWSYVPQDTNTQTIQVGWTAQVQGGGTYTVIDVQPDVPFNPFIAITLSDPNLKLRYRDVVNFTFESRQWNFENNGTTTLPGKTSISGSLEQGVEVAALGQYSHASGLGTVASEDYQTVVGRYNSTTDTGSVFTVGTGQSDGTRQNGFSVRVDDSFITSITLPYTTDGTLPNNPVTGSLMIDFAVGGLVIYDGTDWQLIKFS